MRNCVTRRIFNITSAAMATSLLQACRPKVLQTRESRRLWKLTRVFLNGVAWDVTLHSRHNHFSEVSRRPPCAAYSILPSPVHDWGSSIILGPVRRDLLISVSRITEINSS